MDLFIPPFAFILKAYCKYCYLWILQKLGTEIYKIDTFNPICQGLSVLNAQHRNIGRLRPNVTVFKAYLDKNLVHCLKKDQTLIVFQDFKISKFEKNHIFLNRFFWTERLFYQKECLRPKPNIFFVSPKWFWTHMIY